MFPLIGHQMRSNRTATCPINFTQPNLSAPVEEVTSCPICSSTNSPSLMTNSSARWMG